MADIMKILGNFLCQGTVKSNDYNEILNTAKTDIKTKIYAKSYAESLKNTFKALSDIQYKLFKGVLNKSDEILKEYSRLKIEADKGDAESCVKALGLMYAALKYGSADAEFKKMIDDIKKEDKAAISAKAGGTVSKETAEKNDQEKVKTDEEGVKSAPPADVKKYELLPEGGYFKPIDNFNLRQFQKKEITLEEFSKNEFNYIEATYGKYKKFMKSKRGIYAEKNTSESLWRHIKIQVNDYKEGADGYGAYVEYGVTRTDESMVTVLKETQMFEYGVMKLPADEVVGTETAQKTFRKYVDGPNAGKVVKMPNAGGLSKI